MSEGTRKWSKLNDILQHAKTIFTRCHIVSVGSSKTGIGGQTTSLLACHLLQKQWQWSEELHDFLWAGDGSLTRR